MNTQVIDGRAPASALNERTRQAIPELGRAPSMAAVLVGSDPAADFYASSQERQAKKLGIRYARVELEQETSAEALHTALDRLSANPEVDGIILLTPLPSGLSVHAAREHIATSKDIEGVNPATIGKLLLGRPSFVPPTAQAAFDLAKAHLKELAGVEALVMGYSDTVGKPLTCLLMNAKATVTVARSRVRDLNLLLERAELVFACVGRAGIVRGEQLRPGAVVIDIGTNEVKIPMPDGTTKTAWVGDVDMESAMGIASAITPVPGGVGALTTATLFSNLVRAARAHAGR